METADYYISDGLTNLGPFSAQRILDLVFANKISLTDPVYHLPTKTWSTVMQLSEEGERGTVDDGQPHSTVVGLMPYANLVSAPLGGSIRVSLNHPAEPSATKTSMPAPSPQPSSAAPITWFLKEGNVVLGPYSYLSMLMMLKEGALDDKNFVRQNSSDEWIKSSVAFTQEERKEIDQMLPSRSHSVALSRSWKRKSARKDIDCLMFIRSGPTQILVRGYDVTDSAIAFVTTTPVFKVNQVVSIEVQLASHMNNHLKGRIFRADELTNLVGEMKLHKFVVTLDQAIDTDSLSAV